MNAPFLGLFGNNCELRILELLLPLEGVDLNVTQLANEADVSRPTATRVVKKFVKHGIMKVAQVRGGVNYYEIDIKSPYVHLFEDMNNLQIEQMLGEEELYLIHEHWNEFIASQGPKLPDNIMNKIDDSTDLTPKPNWPINRFGEVGVNFTDDFSFYLDINNGGSPDGAN